MSEIEEKAKEWANGKFGTNLFDAFLAGAKAADDDLKTELREANEIIISCKAEIEKLKADLALTDKGKK